MLEFVGSEYRRMRSIRGVQIFVSARILEFYYCYSYICSSIFPVSDIILAMSKRNGRIISFINVMTPVFRIYMCAFLEKSWPGISFNKTN